MDTQFKYHIITLVTKQNVFCILFHHETICFTDILYLTSISVSSDLKCSGGFKDSSLLIDTQLG